MRAPAPWTRCPISPPVQTVSLRQAILLGALHGPAELLPISSSAHLEAIPWLLGWPESADAGARKAFDVALHGGATAAWLLAPGARGRETLADLKHSLSRRAFLALAIALPAAAGLVLEEPIERRLGTPGTTAAGLAFGSLMMFAADRRRPTRSFDEAGVADGLWLGLAQASALLPGVSRSGATIAAARIRGWGRRDSRRLANVVGLPVIAGANALKGLRMLQQPPRAGERVAVALGAGASFGSAWLAAPLVSRWADDSLAPYAAYRLALALAIMARPRRRA